MIDIHQRHPHAGYLWMKIELRERGKEVLRQIRRWLKHCGFWAAGVNDVWCLDQHDKLNRYGLALHICIDPSTGKFKWLSNPRLIFGYYLDQVKDGCTLQPRYMKEKNNLPPEIAWSGLRRDCVPGLEDILANPHVDYSCDNPLQYNVFKWVAILWFQSELDAYAKLHNSTKRWAQHNKILPHSPPDDIEEHPHCYNALDSKIPIDLNAGHKAEELYAPPDHPVFELVPPEFNYWATSYYQQIGSPVKFYANLSKMHHFPLLQAYRGIMMIGKILSEKWRMHYITKPLPYETGYLGGVRGGLGPEIGEDIDFADGILNFSDDSDNE
ncbi:hypothetical protein K435DRAFT_804750 [Dendrothele bispora CBS 962.96]|uniref:Uncharacterized protein n=1 Tax=Dendrothele bispora (strain CBS 962.96) TaxID=1314807 RepID=A0A4S8LDB3_DENBC|nr:hypothetical protein K435DRAFT_804750 [Dendrothele bispora CBS 962.96]